MKKLKCSAAVLLGLLVMVLLAVSLISCNDTPTVTTPSGTTTVPSDDPITPAAKDGSVIFKETDGTVLKTVQGKEGDALSYTPAKTGYRAYAYYKDAACTVPATLPATIPQGETVLYIQWKDPITYTISFDCGEGVGQMPSLQVTYDEKLTLPANTFTLRGKTFIEWRIYRKDGGYEAFVDGAKIKNLTDTQGAQLTLTAIFETPDAENFTVKDGVVTAYHGNATHVIFPQSAHTISAEVFRQLADASKIKRITVPACYTTIEQGAFAPCTKLEKLTVPFIGGSRTEDTFLAYLFGAESYRDNTYSFQATLSSIYGLLVDEKTLDLSKQVVPTTLKHVTVTEAIYTIDEGAFYMVYGLEKLTIAHNENLYAVGTSAFEGCWQLGYDADYEIQNPLYWLENVETIGDRAFCAYVSEENDAGSSYMFTRLFEIPKMQNMRSVGKEAFYLCVYLMNIEFGDKLETIGAYAFMNCVSAKKISLPDSLTTIGEYAFTSCSSVEEIYLGKNLKSIGAFAFADCALLGTVNLANDSPAKTALIPFSNGVNYKYNAQGQLEGYDPTFTHLKLYVPATAADAYRKAWVSYADRIETEDAATEIFYYGRKSDGTYTAMLRIVGNTVYVTDPTGSLLNLLDYFQTSSLGTEYVLILEDVDASEIAPVGAERFIRVSNPEIHGIDGDVMKVVLRVRPELYEKDGKRYLVPTADIPSSYSALGKGENSLYKIVDDDYGHATLYTRESVTAEWTEVAKPEGAVYTEVYLYVAVWFNTEQYLAVVYEDENAQPISYRYFFTYNDELIPAKGPLTNNAMTFFDNAAWSTQITLDGGGVLKILDLTSDDWIPYVGNYTLTNGKIGDDSVTVSFTDLRGPNGPVSGYLIFDGYFDGGYHRCRVKLSENGYTILYRTLYTSAGLVEERTARNTEDGTRYYFYDYQNKAGEIVFRYAEYNDAEGNASHGTYTVSDTKAGAKIRISVEDYPEVVGTIKDVRLSFDVQGVFSSATYTTYGYDEDDTFYLYEDFYGTIIDYYTLKMDGYGNATLHDEHDDDVNIWYKGTYYNTKRSIGEDDYGNTLWVYCFTGSECTENGVLIENGKTATYYYVVNVPDGYYVQEGQILSISESNGSAAYTVYDEKGLEFARMDVDPFGITVITLLQYTYVDGQIVYTEDTEKSALLAPVAYLTTDGKVSYIVVSDKAGNFLFCLARDENGEWVYTYEHALNPQEKEETVLAPDLTKLDELA